MWRKISWTDGQSKTVYPPPPPGSGGIIRSSTLSTKLPVCRLCWFLYTLNIYAHFSLHFSQQILMAEIWYFVTSFIYNVGTPFCGKRFLTINICWEKCDEKCASMLNVYKSQLSRQTGSRNLTGQNPSKIFFVTFFSATINGRNMIFGHKLHIGMPYCG
jgi:hypothetical protein